MGMGVEHRIDTGDLLPQALGAEIRRRVHNERKAGRLDMDGGAKALIARVGGFADLASASDDWNPMRGPCS